MRCLTVGRCPGEARRSAQAASTAVAVFVALGVSLSGCAAGGTGARDEGPAHAEAVGGVASSSPSPAASPSKVPDRVDAVRLVKADPAVATEVKRELKPCAGDQYPVDVSYGEMTEGSAEDVVVNVLTCGDAVGVGSYVYREEGGAYQNVFKAEEPPVYAEIDRGDLVVTKQVYEKGDPVSSPSGENVITYRWASDRFTEEYRTHNDYSNAVGTAPSEVPEAVREPEPEPEPES
ncbi:MULTISPECIES: hypothetical protein [unclassified Streptomyces]|uniref:hypothetical protein n=1 Tax=unclassified Streptomyces TaxID=2593676 RepID=UPI003634C5BE